MRASQRVVLLKETTQLFAEGGPEQLRIGLLEDDLAIQEMLRLLLEGEGYEVAIYANTTACLTDLRVDDAQSEAGYPDALMIDLHLEKAISGLTIIEQIRANPRLENLPVILMTASAIIDRKKLQHLHVTLVPKPFDIDEVIRLLGELTRV